MSELRDSVLAGLRRVVRRTIGAGADVANLERLSAGANKETWSFDAVDAGKSVPLVLRRAVGGTFPQKPHEAGLENEATLITLSAAAGVPVPPVHTVLTPGDQLGPGFITGFIAGETIARRILRDDAFASLRPNLARQCGEIIARIHSVEDASLPALRSATPGREVALLAKTYAELDRPYPVFDFALRYLRDFVPTPPKRLTLVHGDFRIGNLIIGPEGVRAVLDWENAHIGDPAEDLAWLCINSWRFGNIDKPVGGFGEREDLFAGYEAVSGVAVDPARVQFWEILGSLRWGIICAGNVETFRTLDQIVERAMIARRVSETEIDILRMIAPRRR